jgi:DNA repair protein RadC
MSGELNDRGAGPEQSSLFKEVDQRAGHRQRLKERFVAGGPDALPDYELLELVLFSAIPRRDTKPMAKRLIDRFGSFAEVINAPPERLEEVKGIGEAAITPLKLVRASALRMMQGRIMRRPILTSWDSVVDYCRPHSEKCQQISAK